MGPPPATIPTPTSHCEMIVFSRLAKLMSQASYIRDPDGYIIEVGQSTDLTYG